MTYYADKVTNIRYDDSRRYPRLIADVEVGYEIVQLYQAGALVGSAKAVGGQVDFATSMQGSIDPFFLLAVDPADALTNYWASAFPEAEANGNRIKVSYQTTEDTLLGWKWRVTIDGTIEYEADIFPTSDGAGGYGVAYGVAYGTGPFGAGYGNQYGVNYGFGGGVIVKWVSEPKTNGTYSVAVSVIDKVGNVSTAASSSITIETYPRPASDLAVTGYVSGTDTLSLSWTESEDL